jgi:hypothetical protein
MSHATARHHPSVSVAYTTAHRAGSVGDDPAETEKSATVLMLNTYNEYQASEHPAYVHIDMSDPGNRNRHLRTRLLLDPRGQEVGRGQEGGSVSRAD